MTVILRDFRRQNVTEDELTVLLSFIEEDIHDHQRQSTAFPLLKVSEPPGQLARVSLAIYHH